MKENLTKLWDKLTGNEEQLREIHRSFHSGGGSEAFVKNSKKTNKTIIGGALLALFLVVALWASEASNEGDGLSVDLTRPSPYEKARTIDMDVQASYDGEIINGNAGVKIHPRMLGKAEADEEIMRIARDLPALILAGNNSLDYINTDLALPSSDPSTGADIVWKSSDEKVISNDGRVNLLGTEPGDAVTLSARIRLEASTEDVAFLLKVGTISGGSDEIKDAMERRIAEEVRSINSNFEGAEAILPDMTEDGILLEWKARNKSGHLPELLICIGIVFMGFHYRYRAARKQIEVARDEMERDFPDFIAKLSLLLGAGLVITTAISRVTDDYLEAKEIRGERRLYEELVFLRERMRAGNTPLVREITDLARRSGLREIARFASVLSDNIDKGNALADKLRQESELLWDSRKKRAEKLGRIAETKLIFPMVLQILCVIVITVMPAAFEMS